MSYGWFRAWTRRFAQEHRPGRFTPNVLVLKKEDAVVGITPLVLRIAAGIFRVRIIEFPTNYSDYNDFVLGDDRPGQIQAIANFLARTAKHWDIVSLRDLRNAGDAIAIIERALTAAGLSYCVLPEEERCPYMQVNGPWSEAISRHSRFTRRAYRKFKEMRREGLRVRILENPQHETGLLEKLIALEAQKHVDGELSLPFLGVYPEVFQSLFDTLGPQGWILVVLAEWNDRLVACHLLYRCGKSLWGYQTAYDHTFSQLSPGTMLIPELIDYCYANGLEEFDFLRGEERYKMRWNTGFHETFRLLIWNKRLMSRFRSFVYLNRRVHQPLATQIERHDDGPDISGIKSA